MSLPWRDVTTVGIETKRWHAGAHPPACMCESCGPALLVLLSDYEATRLLDALERRDGSDTGDWHAQIRHKLQAGLGQREENP